MKAIWNGAVIAQSDDTVVVEGNHYFPPDSVKKEFLKSSGMETSCPWKGGACYYTVVVGDKENENAAWFYPAPKKAVKNIKDHIAFWMGVEVVE